MLILTLVFLAVVIRQIVKMRKENELLKDKLEYTEIDRDVCKEQLFEYFQLNTHMTLSNQNKYTRL